MPELQTVPAEKAETPRQIIRFFAIIGAVLGIGMIGYYAYGLHGSWPFFQDAVGYVVGRDFLNTWFFGKAALLPDPGRFYDPAVYRHWLDQTVPQDIFNHLWSYPPSFLLMAAPLGGLSYPVALAVWTLAGLLCLYLAVRGDGLRTLAIFGSTASLFCLIGGQISFFMAALLLGALRLLDRRPLLAGFLIALCTVKPQMGFLFPVLLIASRRWRVLAAATFGTLALVAATSLIWGLDVWRDYIHLGLPAQMDDTKETYLILAPWSPTITTALTMAGVPLSVTSLVQSGFTLLAVLLVILGCRQGPMDERKAALFLACGVFASPYFLAHDLVALSAAALLLASVQQLDRAGALAVKAIVLLPMLQMTLGFVHVPGVALVPVLFAFWALRGDSRKAWQDDPRSKPAPVF